LDHPNNYIQNLGDDDNVAKSLNVLAISLSVSHNYFDDLNKIISDSYLGKFLDTSTKSFFPSASTVL